MSSKSNRTNQRRKNKNHPKPLPKQKAVAIRYEGSKKGNISLDMEYMDNNAGLAGSAVAQVLEESNIDVLIKFINGFEVLRLTIKEKKVDFTLVERLFSALETSDIIETLVFHCDLRGYDSEERTYDFLTKSKTLKMIVFDNCGWSPETIAKFSAIIANDTRENKMILKFNICL